MIERALTLWQPWAWLVANGHKNIENRPVGFSHKSFRGEFWIHAAAESSASIASWPLAAKLCAELLGQEFRIPNARDLSFGAIIGRATITGIVPPRLTLLGKEDPAPLVPWHFHDQYGFRVENALAIASPVPCRGYQGFWKVPTEVLATLAQGWSAPDTCPTCRGTGDRPFPDFDPCRSCGGSGKQSDAERRTRELRERSERDGRAF